MDRKTARISNSQTSKTMKYFKFLYVDPTGLKKYECTLCKRSKCGNQPTNLTSHIKNIHPDIFETQIKVPDVLDDESPVMRLKLL